MNADEKSDKVVVPMKQANKEGLPFAEIVEGRTLPKRNIGQATAVRTQRAGELGRMDWLVCAKRRDKRRMYSSPHYCITSRLNS